MARDMILRDTTAQARFMREYRRLEDQVTVEQFAARLGWGVEPTRRLAGLLYDAGNIDTDRGMGNGPLTLIEPW